MANFHTFLRKFWVICECECTSRRINHPKIMSQGIRTNQNLRYLNQFCKTIACYDFKAFCGRPIEQGHKKCKTHLDKLVILITG